MNSHLRRGSLVLAGSVIYALGLCFFVRTAGLFPGGFTGLSILIQDLCERFFGFTPPYTVLNMTLNLVAAGISFRVIGKRFALLSLTSVAITSILADILPTVALAEDPLLNSVFGGLINGAAVALCLIGGASTGGTDFISIYLSEKQGKDAYNLILGGNIVMLTVAGAVFGWERALYSMIFQFCSTQSVHALYHRYEHRTLWIITGKPDEAYQIIRDKSHHGATLFQGRGLYKNEPRAMLYTVVSGDEVRAIIHEIRQMDPSAFINTQRTDSLFGRFYRRPQI